MEEKYVKLINEYASALPSLVDDNSEIKIVGRAHPLPILVDRGRCVKGVFIRGHKSYIEVTMRTMLPSGHYSCRGFGRVIMNLTEVRKVIDHINGNVLKAIMQKTEGAIRLKQNIKG